MGAFERCRSDVSLDHLSFTITHAVRRGRVVATTEHDEAIVYADIDPQVITETRAGIPVTVQRRFDVYSDVAA